MSRLADDFKIIKGEGLGAQKLINEDYDLTFSECKAILENVKGPFELLSLAFALGYSRAVKAGVSNG